MLKRRSARAASSRRNVIASAQGDQGIDRRSFLRNSGLAGLSLGAIGSVGAGRLAQAQPTVAPGITRHKTICPFCSVGCSIWGEVENGVWVGQEPVFESPINQGTHCAKGAAAREVAIGERRLKYPMKKEGGEWVRISWEQAISEIGEGFGRIRETYGPESVFWLGSAKFSNEMSYLFRKFAAFWGTNNVDHQARICHSTTVAGVANTYGYGAMTNTFNDIRNAKSIIIIGGNPAEAHPVSMLHVLNGKENGAKMVVVDPRFTRTAAHADEYVRIRPGTDVGFLWGLARIILENGWEDREYLDQRVWGFDKIRSEIDHWTTDEVERVTGIPPEQMERIARTLAENRPGTLIWCMGLTQSTIGNNKTRAASILQLILGNIGKTGGGANIFRGHDNVQGATDLGVACDSLPAYYGLSEDAWKHWARVWDVPYDYLRGRFSSKDLMEKEGIPVSRWMDAVLEDEQNVDQPHNFKGLVFWGHASNSQTRGIERKQALEAAEMVVIVDPHPTQTAIENERTDGLYLLPSGTTMECAGSVTNSSRSLQWREKVVDPIFEAKSDYEILYLMAREFGFAEEMFKHTAISSNQPAPEDVLREINRGTWTIGYTGQSPERLKAHMNNQASFDSITLLGKGGDVEGQYYCLPWPSWGDPQLRHPGTPLLYDTSKPVAQGGLPFRARWGVEHDGETLLAEDSFTKGSAIRDGYPEISMGVLEAMGWAGELTAKERLIITAIAADRYRHDMLSLSETEASAAIRAIEKAAEEEQQDDNVISESWGGGDAGALAADDEPVTERFPEFTDNALEAISAYLSNQPEPGEGESLSLAERIRRVNWKTDLSGGLQRVAIAHGLAPYGNGKARCAVWTFPDEVPRHREPLFTARRDLLPDYETYEDRRLWRLPVLYKSIQQVDYAKDFPLTMTSGRLVEFEGGGDETRSNKWLAEFQQQMFVELNPADAGRANVGSGEFCWVHTPNGKIRVKALVTRRVGEGTVFLPFHFAGVWMGQDLSGRYPQGTVPYVTGESVNTIQTYGYDAVTQMQETKATLCRITADGEIGGENGAA
ncbi:formate dehydrogenase major subunit [Poseidonocella pacifica]|uniref:Formate dehydrogenase major subunit n=1 Tax=Poseidonocella pacifica TaxID=871651 RepID=A0A1I0YFA3_9RHOB|nr:formate dehydrogenase subunit alpha [Poseidonocella pacifica]SFB11058.1 formate dehydrogenase major subunit [Poseidonocella pacifica]